MDVTLRSKLSWCLETALGERLIVPPWDKELKFKTRKPYKYNWADINWLQTDKVLIIPKFNVPEDEQAFEQISELMPQYAGCIDMVEARRIYVDKRFVERNGVRAKKSHKIYTHFMGLHGMDFMVIFASLKNHWT